MKIDNIVRFNDERFFDGAVQLGWLEKRPEQAHKAAEAFIFHGPRYHGANNASTDGIDSNYQLKDSASFVKDLLSSMLQGEQEQEANPYWLVVAGYGSGKSHLALTTASLLSAPNSKTAEVILKQLSSADSEISQQIAEQLQALTKPALILPLDGMSGFHLSNALSQSVFKQLASLGIDAEPLRALSPRFNFACNFVERNYEIRQQQFQGAFPDLTATEICRRLKENDEEIYEAVDKIYEEANGQPIPVEGQESAQELIEMLSNLYCGEAGPFSQIIIMFDEFGRYLEYAAEKPHIAGDAALQQIFQGIQDNSHKVRFLGFIQYELKTYVKRFGGAGLRQLQRYITRFDTAEKYYLSTNLETIFAHMIHKNENELEVVFSQTHALQQFNESHRNLSLALPSFSQYPLWQDKERFIQIISRGCWPLHPMAVWFLTRQKDIVQSRSALTFIKDTINQIGQQSVQENGVLKQVSTAELILGSMLSELVAAERQTGGTIAETLQTLLEKFRGHLGKNEQLVLSGIAALEKMRIGKQSQNIADILIQESTALSLEQVTTSCVKLAEIGALEWNHDLGQYELLTDGASRGQFQQWLRKQQLELNDNDNRLLFMRRAASEILLSNIDTDFGLANQISTQDWFFEASFAHSSNLENCLSQAFKDWSQARLPNEAKGKIIYLYIHESDDKYQLEQRIQTLYQINLAHLKLEKAPIWIIGLDDQDSNLINHLGKLSILEEKLTEADKERYRRFIADEIQRAKSGIKTTLTTQLKQNNFWAAGFESLPKERLKHIGKTIFSAIYTQVLPFEFDGFANKTGNGNASSATLMRGLISKQFNGNWVQSQQVQLRNRINTLMVNSWGCLTSAGKMVMPQEPVLKALLLELVKLHQDDSARALNDSYQMLMRPPYGMNTASAGLILSILIGFDTPPRRLVYKNDLLSSPDWIEHAFPKKGHQLNEAVLSLTTIRFLSETSESRWRELFSRWDVAETYPSQIQLAEEMKKLNQEDPIPESLEGTYLYWKQEGEKVNVIVRDKQSDLNKLEKDLERVVNRVSVSHLLQITRKLFLLNKDFLETELWPKTMLSECSTLLNEAQSLLNEHLSEWIPKQICKSTATLAEFKKSIDTNEKTLEILGRAKEAQALRLQASSSINRMDKIQAFQLTLSQCMDYPRQPKPNASTLVRELRDEVARGDSLIETLKAAIGTFTEQEINAYIKAIQERQKDLKEADAAKRNELGELYSAPKNQHELIEMLQKARHLQKVFVDTRDEDELSEIIYQLDYINNDIQQWPNDELSTDRLEELLQNQSTSQEQAFLAHLEEKNIESAWVESIYQALSQEEIKAAYQRSKTWSDVRYISQSEIETLTESKALSLQQELRAMPLYLSDADRERLTQQLSAIEAHLSAFTKKHQQALTQKWLAQFENLDNEALTEHELKQYLNSLAFPPNVLNKEDAQVVKQLELKLQAILDRISVEDILKRIYQLPEHVQRELIDTIANTLIAK